METKVRIDAVAAAIGGELFFRAHGFMPTRPPQDGGQARALAEVAIAAADGDAAALAALREGRRQTVAMLFDE